MGSSRSLVQKLENKILGHIKGSGIETRDPCSYSKHVTSVVNPQFIMAGS